MAAFQAISLNLKCFLWRLHFILTISGFFRHFSGVSAMEIVAMDMKLRGMYIARQLSFKGVTFTVDEVPLTEEFKAMYNDSVKLVNAPDAILIRFSLIFCHFK